MGTPQYGLADKVILVTGGSRGIGLKITEMLIAERAKVIICGRKKENLDQAQDDLGRPDNLTAIPAHVAKSDQVDELFEGIENDFGSLDGLVNNVGMNLMTPALADLEPDLWRKIIDSNLNGTFLVSRRAALIMRGQGRGKIVTVSSIAAQRAAPGMGVYGIAKAGMEMMTKILASELASHGIQVNSVAPSMVKTDFSKPFWSNPELHDHIVQSIPQGRLAETVDVAHPVLFLLSEGSGFINGQTINVDGGASAV